MFPLDSRLLDYLALGAAAVAVLALLLAAAAHLRVRRLRDVLAGSTAAGTEIADSAATAASWQAGEVERLRDELARARADLDTARGDLADAIRHVAVVRYDAFGDMGGRMSFSAALVDDDGDGLVLTSIHGRSETRSYAKGLTGGRSEHPLSPEEEQAVAHALRRPGERGNGRRAVDDGRRRRPSDPARPATR